jgi:hypothetical protein
MLLLAIRRIATIRAIVALSLTVALFAPATVLAFLPAFRSGTLSLGSSLPLSRTAQIFLALPLIGNHAEIVFGELKVVFLLHAVTIQMGVCRQLAEFLQHLRGIAARATVNPVELLATATTLRAIAATPAPVVVVIAVVAVVIAVHIQGSMFLSPGRCLATSRV